MMWGYDESHLRSPCERSNMVHAFFLIFGVGWGIVICVLLFFASMKVVKGMWLVTIPAILVVAAVAINFAGHMLHLTHPIIPYQKQIIDTINWALVIAALPLLLMKLYELWSKKRARVVPYDPPSV